MKIRGYNITSIQDGPDSFLAIVSKGKKNYGVGKGKTSKAAATDAEQVVMNII